jgi:Transglutaminase elicitor
MKFKTTAKFMVNLVIKTTIFIITTHFLIGCNFFEPSSSETQRAWNAKNNPLILETKTSFVREYEKLKKQSFLSIQKTPWSDFYWPTMWGGTSLRWNLEQPLYAFKKLTEQSAKGLSTKQISELSPTEKYDLYVSNYAFSLTEWEQKRTLSQKAEAWWGLCHGWASSSLQYPEPKPVTVKNNEGLEISFGSSDIKALLILYSGMFNQNTTQLVGQRCNKNLSRFGGGIIVDNNSEFTNAGTVFENLAECEDVNAGSFHLILTNLIGEQNEGFVADLTAGSEVWNYPIYGFKTVELGEQKPSKTSAPLTAKEKIVDTEIYFKTETVPKWLQNENTGLGAAKTVLRYTLELDKNDKIIGGEWMVKGYPDFVWKQQRPEFKNYFAKLDKLMQASVGSY